MKDRVAKRLFENQMKEDLEMKRLLVVLVVLSVLFSFGTANAATLSSEDVTRGSKALAGQYGLWWPTAIDAEIASIGANWSWVLVIANWYGDPITINVTLTAFTTDPTNAPTTKSFNIGGFGKIVLTPANFGFFNTISDIWVTSSAAIFGGTLYLLDNNSGRLITTVPHIEIENF